MRMTRWISLALLAVMALAAALLVVTAASPAAAATTTSVQVVPSTQELKDVACSTPTTCVAVGYEILPNALGVVVPIVNGVAGPAQTVPGICGSA